MFNSLHFVQKTKLYVIFVTRNSSPSHVNWYYFGKNVLGLIEGQLRGPGLPCSPRQREGSGSEPAWWRRGERLSGELSPDCQEPRPAASQHGPGERWGPPGRRSDCAVGQNWNIKISIMKLSLSWLRLGWLTWEWLRRSSVWSQWTAGSLGWLAPPASAGRAWSWPESRSFYPGHSWRQQPTSRPPWLPR